MIIPIKPKGFGRVHLPDSRDKDYPMDKVRGLALDKTKMWRTGPILNQRHSSQCVGYAWRQWLSSAPLMTQGGPTAYDIWSSARSLDELPGDDYNGTTVRGGAKALETLGYIKEYVWAYNAEMVRDFVLSTGTVVLGCNWYHGMTNTSFLNYARPTGKYLGGHALLVCGFDHGKNAFRLVNSWGRSWGWNGMAWIKFEHLNDLLVDSGEAAGAIEQEVKP